MLGVTINILFDLFVKSRYFPGNLRRKESKCNKNRQMDRIELGRYFVWCAWIKWFCTILVLFYIGFKVIKTPIDLFSLGVFIVSFYSIWNPPLTSLNCCSLLNK